MRTCSEEDAIAQYGEADIEVYHTAYKPLELTVPQRGDNAGYAKVRSPLCFLPIILHST